MPDLLALATRDASLRPLVARVGDARGRWLAAANPAWAWMDADAAPVDVDPARWGLMTTDERELALLALRASDPETARELLESTWSTDPAAARATLLATLRRGLGPDDVALLERALDDRSAKVRETALGLLDRLPTSARGDRMAARLRGLLSTSGRVRRTLQVELPLEPDPAGVRDGLGAPRAGGSQRDHWLATIIRAAPLDVWTEVSGTDPAGTWRMLRDDRVRSLLVDTVVLRRDARWAAAVLADTWAPRLLALLPPGEVAPLVAPRVARAQLHELPALLGHLATPWDPATSRAVSRRLTGDPDHERTSLAAASLAEQLARGLHPDVRGELRAWGERLAPEQRRRIAPVLSYLTLVPDITEAFS
nr:DUF5691 domain-containing protein [Nocardioides flavescens]